MSFHCSSARTWKSKQLIVCTVSFIWSFLNQTKLLWHFKVIFSVLLFCDVFSGWNFLAQLSPLLSGVLHISFQTWSTQVWASGLHRLAWAVPWKYVVVFNSTESSVSLSLALTRDSSGCSCYFVLCWSKLSNLWKKPSGKKMRVLILDQFVSFVRQS